MGYSIVGEQILKFRKEKGLTQRELGEAIGVSSSAVSQWESGGTPDISLLPALSDILGVTVDALFGRTEVRREDIEETVGKYIASLPEEKRLGRLISLMRRASFAACADKAADIVDIDSRDSEMTYVAKDGFVTAILSEGQSFLSAAHCREGAFADLLSCGEDVARLFSVLSSPDALTVLSKLYSEAPKHRTAGAVAKLAGTASGETEEILKEFTGLGLTEQLELETEDGSTEAYAVNLNRAAVPLLVSARITAEPSSTIKIIVDKKEYDKGGD